MATASSNTTTKGPALVFGASGEQGRAVVEGMVDAGYYPVYAFSRHHDYKHQSKNERALYPPAACTTYLTDALGATLVTGDLQNPDDVLKAFVETKAQSIFLVTTTDLPTEMNQTSGFSDAAEAEFQVILLFFHLLKQAYEKDRIPRHVVFSCRDNVQKVVRQVYDETGELWIQPLDDGSIVPHYSAKARGGEYAMDYLKDVKDLRLTLVTLPFLYSNFLGFFCPLADESQTQWTLSACFGDGSNPIDMMGLKDVGIVVPNIFDNRDKYDGKNLRLVGQRISMDQVADAFEDLYGKPVIYNPLTVAEVADMPFAAAPAMAQMCQFVGDSRSLAHDLDATKQAMNGKTPQTFEDWLLTHSESSAFQQSGLTVDAPEIESVTVFGATSPEGTSVVKGLLADTRKTFAIRATSNNIASSEAKAVKALAPNVIELVEVDLDDVKSCQKAVEGVDGVFLVTHFLQENQTQDLQVEERHIQNVIDACEAAHSVRHLVFSTLESAEVVHHMQSEHDLGVETKDAINTFDARARAAAYAKTKKLSVTIVLLPYYSESFFNRMSQSTVEGKQTIVFDVPADKQQTKYVCMSVDDLGQAVANIFDSYQVYAGHEIGLVTDLVSYADVKQMMEGVILQSADGKSGMVLETEEVKRENLVGAKDTYMKDLGQMFGHLAHSDAVKMRRSVAKTMELVPSARPLREWIQQNMNNEDFREKLGLR